MQLLLPPDIVKQLMSSLTKAAEQEIGGILMGEHVGENVFRVKNLTIQHQGGRFASFVRAIQNILEPLRNFFNSTNNEYTRFNYLGEWHSHPSFVPTPSTKDEQTMWDIIEDPNVGAYFVVLMIIKLDAMHKLIGSVTVYQPGGLKFIGELVQEGAL